MGWDFKGWLNDIINFREQYRIFKQSNNLTKLLEFGYKFIGPVNGEMACGEYGEGKMSSPRQILSYIKMCNFEPFCYVIKTVSYTHLTLPTTPYV